MGTTNETLDDRVALVTGGGRGIGRAIALGLAEAWIRSQEPALVGAELHRRFVDNYAEGSLLTPERSAASLLARIAGPETGQLWDAADRL